MVTNYNSLALNYLVNIEIEYIEVVNYRSYYFPCSFTIKASSLASIKYDMAKQEAFGSFSY